MNYISDGNFCWTCSTATLTPDGNLRCGTELAKETCGKFSFGKPKLWKPKPVVVENKGRKRKK